MNENDFPRFAAIMALMAQNFRDELFGNRIVSDLQYRFRILTDYTIEQIEDAANVIVSKRRFMKMPTVGEIIDTIEEDETPKISHEYFSSAINVFEMRFIESNTTSDSESE